MRAAACAIVGDGSPPATKPSVARWAIIAMRSGVEAHLENAILWLQVQHLDREAIDRSVCYDNKQSGDPSQKAFRVAEVSAKTGNLSLLVWHTEQSSVRPGERENPPL